MPEATSAAAAYLHGHHDSVLRSHRWRTAANSAGYLVPRLEPGTSVLDVGCGPGSITVDLARLVDGGRVVGVDAAEGVLVDARAEAVRRGIGNVDFEVGDVHHLAFEDEAFDVVHAHQLLQHLPDPVGALVEMKRVCRPGGIVAARDGDYGAMFWAPEDPEMEEWLALYRRVATAVGGEPDAGRQLPDWARRAGFADITVSASTWCYAATEDRTWWGDLWAERVMKSSFAHQAVRRGLASPTDLERLARAWHRWSTCDEAMFVVPHIEVLCRA